MAANPAHNLRYGPNHPLVIQSLPQNHFILIENTALASSDDSRAISQSQAQVKTLIAPELEIIPSNVIFFPHQLGRKACCKSNARSPLPAQTNSAESNLRKLSPVPSQSKDPMHGLVAETRDILTRYSGIRSAMARSRVVCFVSNGSRNRTLLAQQGARGPDHPFETDAATTIHHAMKISKIQDQLEELFALKRQECPPKNFLKDFLQEFHKRIEPATARPRRPACERKVSHIL